MLKILPVDPHERSKSIPPFHVSFLHPLSYHSLDYCSGNWWLEGVNEPPGMSSAFSLHTGCVKLKLTDG
jgi:hypothetical protein